MDGKGKSIHQNESSLLFKLPNSMLSFNEMSSSPLLMPVAVEKTDDFQRRGSTPGFGLDNLDSSSKQSMPASNSLCQLEQPLMMRKTSTSPSVQPSAPQVYSQFPVSSHVGPPSSDKQIGFSRPPVENEATIFSVKSCPVSEEFAGNHQPERTEIPPISNTAFSQDFYSNQSSNPAFCPITSENHSDLPSIYPRSSGETTESLSAHNKGVPMPNSHDSKYFQAIPNNNFQSTSHSSYQNQNDVYFHYVPVKPHWLFEDTIESKEIWYGFSEIDSEKLEAAFQKGVDSVVPTDGGRYDVYLDSRVKKSVYFEDKDLHVRRSTWFYYNGSSSRCKPYDEDTAKVLEQHYYSCVNSGHWQRRFNVPGIGSFVFESLEVLLHYKNELEVWPSLPDSKASPRVVKRGLPDGFEILPNEATNIDHLVFIVQGIGSFCDLRFRTVSQCVDGFRDIANKLIASHFGNEVQQGCVNRVEFLPVAWHAKLHTSDVGLDRRMQTITLPSIPKLRHFTNDTLIDILLYSSPSYCQSILDTVACELNELYELFSSRNPGFSGKILVAGHSLGSLILFDILANQQTCEDDDPSQTKDASNNLPNELNTPNNQSESSQINISEAQSRIEMLLKSLDLEDYVEVFTKERIDYETLILLSEDDLKDLGLPVGPRKKLLKAAASKQNIANNSEVMADSHNNTQQDQMLDCVASAAVENNTIYPARVQKSGMSLIAYPRLQFQPACFFALGSPISMFLAVRGYDTISENFKFPTCPAFFHIFHPYDPVAFRIEPLIDPSFLAKPMLIPHHKGRKRMHLEIRENVSKIANEIKQKLMDTMRYTWNSLSEFAKNHSFPNAIIEAEVDKLVEQEMSEPIDNQADASSADIKIGLLNGGRRIDYVLQEKPIEALNDYVFALTSHATYWDSEDTVLMILREIYAMQGIFISSQQIENKPPIQHLESFDRSASLDSIALMGVTDKTVTSQKNFDYNQTFYRPTENVPPAPPQVNNFNPPNPSNTITSTSNSQAAASIPASNPVGPPPLSGFVKRSAFTR
ncbi:SEC23-interacting protein [Trichonephila inaurata madagascariensis]|uniref:SEC23-interacting protein n=1 Tax=Trichonephila inaurata madagascariensis TaxID=2747483 RepID=A0A8X6M935_9ARAC|nr:SEC23-interacting protein [Trichonephila inaurata madagascariensis]